jgi:hypothetical protein
MTYREANRCRAVGWKPRDNSLRGGWDSARAAALVTFGARAFGLPKLNPSLVRG